MHIFACIIYHTLDYFKRLRRIKFFLIYINAFIKLSGIKIFKHDPLTMNLIDTGTNSFPLLKYEIIELQIRTSMLILRAPVCKNQTNSKFRGKGGKFDFFHILMLHRLGYY